MLYFIQSNIFKSRVNYFILQSFYKVYQSRLIHLHIGHKYKYSSKKPMEKEFQNQQNQSSGEDSNFDYSDDEAEYSKLERSQIDFQKNQSQSLIQKVDSISLQNKSTKPKQQCLVSKQIELMYILFCSFKNDLQETAKSLGCQLKLILNQYKISALSNESRFQECKKIIQNQISKIKYEKVKDQNRRFKMYYSKYINKEAEKEGIFLCKFNKEIYVYSNKLSSKQLYDAMTNLTKISHMHCIFYMFGKHQKIIQTQIPKFIQKVIDIYKDRFQPKDIIVEIDKSQTKINVIGSINRDIMAAKNTMKNTIESMTCIAIKNYQLDQKKYKTLQKYLAKISPDYPIHLSKISQNSIMIISKDLILQQLLKKTQKVIEYFGISDQTEFGVFIPCSKSRVQKKAQIFNLCKDEGYDFYDNMTIKYLRKMVITQGEVSNCRQFITFLIRLIDKFMDVKEKYEIMAKNQQLQTKKKAFLEESKELYQISGNKVQNMQLKKLLRRDNHEDKVTMKQKYVIDYNLFQGTQIGQFYLQRKAYDRGQVQLFEKSKLKKGEYLIVKIKVPNNTSTTNITSQSIQSQSQSYSQQNILTTMKKLQQEIKMQNRHYRDRKVAHLVQKIVYIY